MTLSDITLALGNLAGNRGTTYAAGAGALVTSQIQNVSSKLRDALNKAGTKIGPVLGSAIPEALAAGAAQTGAPATSALEQKYLGYSLPQLALYAGGAVVAGWILWKTLRATSRS